MDLEIQGKVALVTAASKGLGRAVAEALAAEGARVCICARTTADVERTAEEIGKTSGAEVFAVTTDVSKLQDLASTVDAVKDRWGPVEILVNNAGGPPAGFFEQHDADTWQSAYELTLRSVVETCRLVVPDMRARHWGRIINVTSISVKQPVHSLMLSNSLRAGVTGFARTLANEVAADGITVNNLLPGFTKTSRVEQLAKTMADKEGTDVEAVYDLWREQIPMRRLADPREFGALAAFLASPRASYITAQSVAIDGGWIRGFA
jgi:3-oxoacyl-[acyl-carrier protein] reductase